MVTRGEDDVIASTAGESCWGFPRGDWELRFGEAGANIVFNISISIASKLLSKSRLKMAEIEGCDYPGTLPAPIDWQS